MTVDVGAFGTATEVTQFLMGDTGKRGITLYIAGEPAGSSQSRADYWSLTQDDAIRLGSRLIEEAGRARGRDEAERH